MLRCLTARRYRSHSLSCALRSASGRSCFLGGGESGRGTTWSKPTIPCTFSFRVGFQTNVGSLLAASGNASCGLSRWALVILFGNRETAGANGPGSFSAAAATLRGSTLTCAALLAPDASSSFASCHQRHLSTTYRIFKQGVQRLSNILAKVLRQILFILDLAPAPRHRKVCRLIRI